MTSSAFLWYHIARRIPRSTLHPTGLHQIISRDLASAFEAQQASPLGLPGAFRGLSGEASSWRPPEAPRGLLWLSGPFGVHMGVRFRGPLGDHLTKASMAFGQMSVEAPICALVDALC